MAFLLPQIELVYHGSRFITSTLCFLEVVDRAFDEYRAGGSNDARTRTVILCSFFHWSLLVLSCVQSVSADCLFISAHLYPARVPREHQPSTLAFCLLLHPGNIASLVRACKIDSYPPDWIYRAPGKSNNRLPPFFCISMFFSCNRFGRLRLDTTPRQSSHLRNNQKQTHVMRHDGL